MIKDIARSAAPETWALGLQHDRQPSQSTSDKRRMTVFSGRRHDGSNISARSRSITGYVAAVLAELGDEKLLRELPAEPPIVLIQRSEKT